MYGQTEATARLSYLPPERLDDKPGSVGRGLPHTRLEVLRPDGSPGRAGLRTRWARSWPPGQNVTPGYWGDAEETGRYFRDGKLYTGDLAKVDADGFLFIVERARDFIKAMGHRVGPKEVEEVLAEMPQVVEAAVVGAPRPAVGRSGAGVRRHRQARPIDARRRPKLLSEAVAQLQGAATGRIRAGAAEDGQRQGRPPVAEMPSQMTADRVDSLIAGPQYGLAQAEKDVVLAALLRWLCEDVAQRCPPYRRFLDKLGGPPDAWRSPADVPPLPVAMFKRFLLSAVPPEKVVRELHSSSTTGQQPSRIADRQDDRVPAVARAGVDPEGAPRHAAAAVPGDRRGRIGPVGRQLDGPRSGHSRRGQFRLRNRLRPRPHVRRRPGRATSIASPASSRNMAAGRCSCSASRSSSGRGSCWRWSAWASRSTRPRRFCCTPAAGRSWPTRQCRKTSSAGVRRRGPGRPTRGSVLDFYGMVEQVGTVFVDCPAGNKHAPAFADVILRQPLSLWPAEPGQSGIIEVLSVLPTSYPGHALLTEDQGTLAGRRRLPLRPQGQVFPFHQPHRARRTPRLRRYLRPSRGSCG